VDGFTEGDRDRTIEIEKGITAMNGRLELLERDQRVSLKRIRRLPDLTATAIVKAVSKRALFLIGLGIALGSLLGGAGIEVARKMVAAALAGAGH